jgi:hypothetical protein
MVLELTTKCGDFSLVVSCRRPNNRDIRKMFRKPTEITIMTKDNEHFKPLEK